MSTTPSSITLWNLMELSEKQRLMRQFLSLHDDHFSREDFVRFLAERLPQRDCPMQPGRGHMAGRPDA